MSAYERRAPCIGSSPPVRYMRYMFPTDIPSAAVLCGPVLILYCVVLFSIHTHVLCGPVFKYLNSHTHCARYIFEALARTLTAKRRRSFLSNRRVAQTALSHARAGRRALPMHSMASLPRLTPRYLFIGAHTVQNRTDRFP